MTLAYNDPALEAAAPIALVGTSTVPDHLTQKQFVASAQPLIFAVACTGFCLSILAFWPGFMEFDSFDQYAQAIGREPLNDWHPVIMALLWRVLIRFHDGPEPMLLLQMALYWSGFLYLALQMLRRGRPALAWGAILIPFLPFLLNFSGVVWKDTHMALAFFWAALILAFARRSMWSAATSLLLIFYGLAVRHNGIAAALPLLILWGHNFAGLINIRHRFSAALFTAGAAATILVLTNFAIDRLLAVEQTNPLHHQMLNEIAYMQCHSGGPVDLLTLYPGDALKELSPADRQIELCRQVDELAAGGDTDDIFEKEILASPDDDDPRIFPLWLQTLRAHASEYLAYRLIVYRTFLRPFSYLRPYYVFCDGRQPNQFPERFSSEPANALGLATVLRDYIGLASKMLDFLFRPFFWLIALVVTAGLSLWKKTWVAGLICLSGLCYLGAYLLSLPAPDFRYAYWAIFAQMLGGFLLPTEETPTLERDPPVTEAPA